MNKCFLMGHSDAPNELLPSLLAEIERHITELGVTEFLVGSHMYLAKVAMDITAKHIPADKDGVRVAELDEISYREKLWPHTPLTDFWMIGERTAARLAKWGVHTMDDIAKLSLANEELFFQVFGVDAELMIDHSWGLEPCAIRHIKRRPYP